MARGARSWGVPASGATLAAGDQIGAQLAEHGKGRILVDAWFALLDRLALGGLAGRPGLVLALAAPVRAGCRVAARRRFGCRLTGLGVAVRLATAEGAGVARPPHFEDAG